MRKKKYTSDLWFEYLQSTPMTPEDEKMIQEFLAESNARRNVKTSVPEPVKSEPKKKKAKAV